MRRCQVFLEKKASYQLGKLSEDAERMITAASHILRDEGFFSKTQCQETAGYKNHYGLRVDKSRIILFELGSERTMVVYAILPRKVACRT